MMVRIAILVLAAAMLGCGPGTTADEVEEALEPSAEHFLVWWSVEEGGYSTALVRADEDGATVVAEGQGLFVAAGDAIWAWEERKVESTQLDCECSMEAEATGGDTSACMVERQVTSAELVEVDGAKTLEAFPVQPKYEGEVDPNPGALGSSGPFLFSSDCSYGYFCGAHGNAECSFKAWNLAEGKELVADDLVVALSAADQVGLLNTEDRDEPVTEETLVGLVEVRPRWNESGEISLDALYSASACYACSDGEWSSYTVSAHHRGATPKVELEQAPAPVLEVWNTTTGARGWSRLPGAEVERVRALLR